MASELSEPEVVTSAPPEPAREPEAAVDPDKIVSRVKAQNGAVTLQYADGRTVVRARDGSTLTKTADRTIRGIPQKGGTVMTITKLNHLPTGTVTSRPGGAAKDRKERLERRRRAGLR